MRDYLHRRLLLGRLLHRRLRETVAGLLLVIAVLGVTSNFTPPPAQALATRISFGTASTYAILGGTAITNTGITPLSGTGGTDIGLSPVDAYTAAPGSFPGIGATNIVNAAAAKAKVDLQAAYDQASAMTPTPILGELGGTNLAPGVYTPGVGGVANAAAWTMTTGFTLTGDADSVFIFQTDAAASTAAGMVMTLAGGVQACNIIWRVGAAFSTGAGVDFSGRVIAYAGISTGAATVIHGQLLGLNTAPITIGAANSIVNDGCIGDPATTFVESALGPMKFGVPFADSVLAGSSDAAIFDPSTDVSYTVSSGALPPGVIINAQTGSVTGTPTMPGPYTFTLSARILGHTAVTQSYAVTVKPGPQPTIDLGAAGSYALLGQASIVNVGTSTLSGNAGTDVGVTTLDGLSSLPGTLQGVGNLDIANTAATTALADLQTARLHAATVAPGRPVGAELGGLTLAPGIYENAAAFGLTGSLTLDAGGNPNAVFIIRTPAALVTAAGAQVILENGTQACNVFWVVGGAATLGATNTFSGRILAAAGITLGASAVVRGQLLTSAMSVTLAGTSVINDVCVPGVLSVTTQPATVPPITLTGSPQNVVATSPPWAVTDNRYTGNPWTLTVSGTDFVSAAGSVDTNARIIPVGNLVISAGAASLISGLDPAASINGATINLSGTPQPLLWSAGDNTGGYGISPTFTLTINSNTFRSNFSGAVNGSPMNPYVATVTYTTF